jgi:type III secretion inner rod protein HrpB2
MTIPPIPPIAAVPANQVLEQSAARPPALGELADKFNRMVEHQPEPAAPHGTAVGAETTISHFIGAQESAMRQSFDAVRTFSAQAPGMNPGELASRQIELSYQLSMVQVQFNAGVYVSQSCKSGLQTLMKNQ